MLRVRHLNKDSFPFLQGDTISLSLPNISHPLPNNLNPRPLSLSQCLHLPNIMHLLLNPHNLPLI